MRRVLKHCNCTVLFLSMNEFSFIEQGHYLFNEWILSIEQVLWSASLCTRNLLVDTKVFFFIIIYTKFSKRSAHWFTPVLPVTLGHWPWPRVMSILSNGLDSNMQKTPFKNFLRFSGATQTFQDCERTVLSFETESFASYSQDQLTKLKWSEVGVGDLGTSEN